MNFKLPEYLEPDFNLFEFVAAPDCKTEKVEIDGVAPDNYHGTSIYPEYFKINGEWILCMESRMDCVSVVNNDNSISSVEFRNLKIGQKVVTGRSENGSEGIYVYTTPFKSKEEILSQTFCFRSGRSRETSYSKDYDNLYELLKYEKDNGYIIWVLGPAASFDHDSKSSMAELINHGYAHAVFAGNALATHDLEGSSKLKTALGQNIYTQKSCFNSHYNHIDILNEVRRAGSIEKFIEKENINDGIMYACIKNKIPFVLAGSIRDDGPLPEVYSDVYKSQDAMRNHVKKATTIICLATMLHTIATGNMAPIFRVINGNIRPLYIYNVDISEFAVNKLRDRGSIEVTSIVANIQDFLVNVKNNLIK